jgi:hypothetical protein
MNNFKITKSLNNNYVLNLREAYGTKAIAQIATPDELIEAREWVEKFYEGDYKIEALKDLTPQVLKYKNGAVVYAPFDGTHYWFIDDGNTIDSTSYLNGYYWDRARLENKNMFLTKEEAQTYLEKLKIYNKLEKRITIINHENDWVDDWDNTNQKKHYLCHTYNVNFVDVLACVTNEGAYYMCKQAIDWLLSDEVSDEERKIWIEGV